MSTDNTPLRRVSHKAPAPCISDVIQTVIQANTRSEQLVELETLRQSIHEKQYSVDVIVHELASIRALIKWWSRQENRFIMQSVMNILYVIYQQTSTIEPFIAPYLELLEHTCDTSYLTQDTSSTRALPTKVDHQECLLHFIYVLLRDIRRQVKRASNSDSSIAMHRPLLVWVAQHVNSWSESVDIKGQTRMALLAILAEWIRLQGKYSLTMDEPVVVEQITHIMQFTAQAYRDEADFSAYHRLLDLLTTILKDTSIKLTRNVVSTIHVIANAFHFNEWESNDEDNNYNCNRMLDDQSDFCFDNETRQWPPISLMRRLVLAFLYYINHPTLHQMLMNTEGNYPHISNNKTQVTSTIETTDDPTYFIKVLVKHVTVLQAMFSKVHLYFSADDRQLFTCYRLLVEWHHFYYHSMSMSIPDNMKHESSYYYYHYQLNIMDQRPIDLFASLMQSISWDIGLLLDWTTSSETREECLVFMTAVYNNFTHYSIDDNNDHIMEVQQTKHALIDLQQKLYTALKYKAVPYHSDLSKLLNFTIPN